MPNTLLHVETQDDHLDTFREELADFILNLAVGATDIEPTFAGKLKTVLSIYRAELQRRVQGADGSPNHFEAVVLASLMGFLLMTQHLEVRTVRKKAGIRLTADDRRVARFLLSALEDFEHGRDDMEQRLPAPRVLARLPEKLWFLFYNVTQHECRADADAIRVLLEK